jgi:26S proteasome regulatory subunit T2
MSLADDVDLEELVMTKDDLSGADIKAVCSTFFSPSSSLACRSANVIS